MPDGSLQLLRDEDDFLDLFAVAADARGIRADVVEKDYWVSQALRGLHDGFTGQFIFKGGTSLSKAYGIIERFSEDVDILVRPVEAESKNALYNRLKSMGKAAVQALGKQGDPVTHANRDGLFRTVELPYPAGRDPGTPMLPFIRLDIGISGGEQPHGNVRVGTMIGDLLVERGQAEPGQYADLDGFELPVLHPGRTLVEKLILVNTVARAAHDDLGVISEARVGRHFYDIHCLLGHTEACALVADAERFREIVADAERISAEHFGGCFARPQGGYADGPAFRGDAAVMAALQRQYDEIMDVFYFGEPPHPPFADVVARVDQHAAML